MSSTFPLTKLPPEILLKVFQHLEPNDVIRCLRINRPINGFIENYRNELPKQPFAIVLQRLCKNGFKVLAFRSSLAWRHEFYEESTAPEGNNEFPVEHFKNVHNWLTPDEWVEREKTQLETRNLRNCITGFIETVFPKVSPNRLELHDLEPEEIDQVIKQVKISKLEVNTLVLQLDRALSPQITELVKLTKPNCFNLTVQRNVYLQNEELAKIVQQKDMNQVCISSKFGGPTYIMDDVILGWKGVLFSNQETPTLKMSRGGLRKIVEEWTTGSREHLVLATTFEGEDRNLSDLLSPFTIKEGLDENQKHVLRSTDEDELHVVLHPTLNIIMIGFSGIELGDHVYLAREEEENPENRPVENPVAGEIEAAPIVQEQPTHETSQISAKPQETKERPKKEEHGCSDCVIL